MLRISVAPHRLLCFAIVFPALVYGLTPSSVTLTASPNPANYGQTVTLSATVTSGATGKVTFYDGVTILGVGTISGTQAALTTVMLASGNRSLRAYYGGDGTYAVSSSALVPETVVAGTSLGLRHAVNFPTSSATVSMAVGDFNGDGKLDFVTASSFSVSVFLGNGDGTFQAGATYGAFSWATSVAVGDFNGDGRMDLVVADQYTSNLSVLLGNGDGTFQSAVNYPVAPAPNCVAVGDFNGDGNADLVVANGNAGYVGVLLGNGDGTFRATVDISMGSSAFSVAVGDFNGDGRADIVAGTASGVSILLGNGDGTFAAALNNSATSYTAVVAVSDFNGDGKADLVAGGYVLLGNGDGTFGGATDLIPGGLTRAVVVADIDGDGKADLVAIGGNGGTLSVLLGNGNGTFAAAMNYAAGQYPHAVAAGDFNGDGKTDLIVTSDSYSGYSEWLGGAITDLAIAVTHSGAFTQGQIGATYTITVSNVGDIPSSGAVGVLISLPSGLTATSLAGSGWTCVLATLACARSDSLAGGASDTITLRVNMASGLTGNATATVTVSGGGDQNTANNYAADTAFIRFSTAITLLSSPNPAVLGHAVTLTATVTTGATGIVTFYDGNTVLGAATLAGGQAVFTAYLLPSGVRSLRAGYVGDSNYGPSISATRTQTVNAAAANGLLPSSSYTVGAGAFWIGVGDFNGDGTPDLVTLNGNGSSGTMSVLLGNGDGTFHPAVNYSVGDPHYGATLGDFNGDGKADVAIAGGDGLYVLLGNGDGTFRTQVPSLPIYVTSLGSADFNGDGIQDLVGVSNYSVVVALGNGDGTFQPPVAVTASGMIISSVAVADMNGDGKADLVGFNAAYSGGVSVLLGNGDGTFQSAVNGPASSNAYPMAFAIGDFNGDGRPDVAITYGTGVAVQLGNGDGTLQPSIQSSLGFAPGYFLTVGDFNGDGKLDIGYTGYALNYLSLALGNGDGTFGYGVSYSTDSAPGNMVQGDFNGDGRPDFAVCSSSTGISTVNVFLGTLYSGLSISATHAANFSAGQAGSYQIAIRNPAFAGTSGTVTVTDTLPAGLSATAIGGTGWSCTLNTLTCTRSDILNNSASYPNIAIAVNVSGSLPPSTVTNLASVSASGITNTAADPTIIVAATTTTLAVSPYSSSLGQTVTMTATVTAGATGTVVFSDGITPLGTVALSGGQATFSSRLLPVGQHSLVATYTGDATHAPSISTAKAETVNASPASGFSAAATYATGTGPRAIAAGDFNQDGKTDLVTANYNANTVSVLLGSGNGTFGTRTDYAVGTTVIALVTGDFNRDGKTDIAVASDQNTNNVSILLGNGDGTFQPAVHYTSGLAPSSLAVGDLNGDGKLDLVVANRGSETLTLLFGNGDGTFHAAASTLSVASPSAVAIADFNQDGRADIVFAYDTYSLWGFLGNADGTYHSVVVFSSPTYFSTLAVGDLNADGKADIVVADGNGVYVVLGNGDGTFQPYVHYVTGSQAASLLFADVNGDGKLDLVAVNSGTNTISVLPGNGDGTLQPAISYAVGSGPQGAVAGDFNGDGRTDLAIANSLGNSVSVLLGVTSPVFTVTSSHAGSFALGQIGAVYTLIATNNGPGTTSGTVTVTDTLPTGLTATGMAGMGWSCTLATLTCTRSDSLVAGASYPAITLTLNVAVSPQASVTNQVSISGGGMIPVNATDPTVINLPVLSIAVSHTGNFAQGQMGATYTITVSNGASAGPTGGTVSVTETVPFGMTLVSMAGTGWTCPAGGTTCTRSDPLNGGSSYPAITVTVNVESSLSSPATNSVSVSGGGSASSSAIDSTIINAGPQNLPPAIVSLSPFSGSGNQTFTLGFSDPNGWADIAHAYLIINLQTWVANSCYVDYNVAANAVSLMNDAGTNWLGPVPAGSPYFLSNSQCKVSVAGSSTSGSGNNLTVNLALSFQPSYTGAMRTFLMATDSGGLTADWLAYGVWWPNPLAASLIKRYRLYFPVTYEHLYTTDLNEYNVLGAEGWNQEGTDAAVYNGPAALAGVNAVPMWRLYYATYMTHLWTTDRNEYLTLMNYRGMFVGEGADQFLFPSQVANSIPLYRLLFNNGGGEPIHTWTTDAHEFSVLTAPGGGWISEGIPGYLFPPSMATGQGEAPVVMSAQAGIHVEQAGQRRVNASGAPEIGAIVHGASYEVGPVAAGQVIRLYGSFPEEGELRVVVGGVEAEVVTRTEREIQAVIPEAAAGVRVAVTVMAGGRRSNAMEVKMVDAAPGLLASEPYGRGQAQAANEDGSANSAANPAAAGSIVTLRLTGHRGRKISVQMGGRPAEVVSQRELGSGKGEVRVRIPAGLAAGAAVPVRVKAGEFFGQAGVTVAVK